MKDSIKVLSDEIKILEQTITNALVDAEKVDLQVYRAERTKKEIEKKDLDKVLIELAIKLDLAKVEEAEEKNNLIKKKYSDLVENRREIDLKIQKSVELLCRNLDELSIVDTEQRIIAGQLKLYTSRTCYLAFEGYIFAKLKPYLKNSLPIVITRADLVKTDMMARVDQK